MARRTGPALIVALALACGGCPIPVYHFQPVDLGHGEPAPSTILAGEHVVVRIENGSGPDPRGLRARLDVFPASAVIRGAWFKVAGRFDVCEGPVKITHVEVEPGSLSLTPDPDRGYRCTPVTAPARAFSTLWIGPVCVDNRCDSFRVDDADWPRRK